MVSTTARYGWFFKCNFFWITVCVNWKLYHPLLNFCQRKTGLFHLSADPISKYELLNIVNSRLGKKIKIKPTETPFINRSLNSNKLRAEFGWHPKN